MASIPWAWMTPLRAWASRGAGSTTLSTFWRASEWAAPRAEFLLLLPFVILWSPRVIRFRPPDPQVLSRKAKNRYSWIGFSGIPQTLTDLKVRIRHHWCRRSTTPARLLSTVFPRRSGLSAHPNPFPCSFPSARGDERDLRLPDTERIFIQRGQ